MSELAATCFFPRTGFAYLEIGQFALVAIYVGLASSSVAQDNHEYRRIYGE